MKRNKKIAFFDAKLTIGGVEKVMITYANQLAAMGFDVSFIYCNKGELDELLDFRIKQLCLNVSHFRYAIFKLNEVLRKEQITHVFCSNIQTLYIVLARILGNYKLKIISSHHFYCNNSETKLYYKFGLKLIYNQCDKVIAVANGIGEELIKVVGVIPDKVTVLKNPIDIDEIINLSCNESPKNLEGKTIVWVGRFSVVKNISLLINAFCKFIALKPEYKLCLVGDGPERLNIEKMVSVLGISNSVSFMGVQQNPYPFIRMASIVSLCSESEAYPTILLEALALGKTIASTPTKGAREILGNSEFGYISTDFSVDSYLEALLKADKNPKNSIDLKTKAACSRIDITINELLDVLDSL